MYSRLPQTTVHTTPSSQTHVIVLSMDCRILHVTNGTGALAHLLSKGAGPILSHAQPLPHPLLDVSHSIPATLENRIAAEDWNLLEIDPRADSMDGTVRLPRIRHSRSGSAPTIARGRHLSACRSLLFNLSLFTHEPRQA
jgi:hypothetical protein